MHVFFAEFKINDHVSIRSDLPLQFRIKLTMLSRIMTARVLLFRCTKSLYRLDDFLLLMSQLNGLRVRKKLLDLL